MRFIYVGIDAAKEKHMAEMKDRAGNTLLTPITFDADLHDIEQIPEKTCHAASKQDAKPIFAMEATEKTTRQCN